jgi:uncharacterized protein
MPYLPYLLALALLACTPPAGDYAVQTVPAQQSGREPASFSQRLSDAAMALTRQQVVYDPSYFSIAYPNGDVPSDKGVCTDVIVRAYRSLGIDLQQRVHEDMKANFHLYPNHWGLSRPDPNIDHRRVPNLQTYFSRHGTSLPVSLEADRFRTGDIVTWDLGRGIGHIGIVVHQLSRDGKRPMLVHNIGAGQVMEDCLFSWRMTGHYRYSGAGR